MRKLTKIISLLLTITLTLTIAPFQAGAAGKYGFINYSRIRGDDQNRIVTLQMGNLTLFCAMAPKAIKFLKNGRTVL
jgi:hypothetical protein